MQGFSDVFDLRVLREAELKHGRFAMLAVLGFIVQETYTLPFFPKMAPVDMSRGAGVRGLDAQVIPDCPLPEQQLLEGVAVIRLPSHLAYEVDKGRATITSLRKDYIDVSIRHRAFACAWPSHAVLLPSASRTVGRLNPNRSFRRIEWHFLGRAGRRGH